jgi:acyl carrier protein
MNSDAILIKAAQIIRDTIGCGPVEITRVTRAMDIRGWDSLSHTMVLMQLEEGFGVQLPMDRVLRLGNVGEMVDLIAELLSSGGASK